MLFEFLCWFFKAEFASSWNVILNFRLALQREAEERRKAEEMNKKLEEKARSLEMTAREAAEGNFKNAQVSKTLRFQIVFTTFLPALEREKLTNQELEQRRLSAEEENARQRERSRQIEREKNMISRELSQRDNENEYLVCLIVNYY
jgi:hypothetical protein